MEYPGAVIFTGTNHCKKRYSGTGTDGGTVSDCFGIVWVEYSVRLEYDSGIKPLLSGFIKEQMSWL